MTEVNEATMLEDHEEGEILEDGEIVDDEEDESQMPTKDEKENKEGNENYHESYPFADTAMRYLARASVHGCTVY